jgi:hypothetical protein
VHVMIHDHDDGGTGDQSGTGYHYDGGWLWK